MLYTTPSFAGVLISLTSDTVLNLTETTMKRTDVAPVFRKLLSSREDREYKHTCNVTRVTTEETQGTVQVPIAREELLSEKIQGSTGDMIAFNKT